MIRNRQPEISELCADALLTIGLPSQLSQLQEECAELIAAVNQVRRSRKTVLELAEAVIGTQLVLNQIAFWLIQDHEPKWELAMDRQLSKLRAQLDHNRTRRQ